MQRLLIQFMMVLVTFMTTACSDNANENNETPVSEAVTVALNTNLGSITLELDAVKAPKTVENFVQYVESGFYDGLIFHRVIPGFMIQGGGFDKSFNQLSTRDNIENEANNGLKNDRGTIAMARTPDPHSASSQFFINLADNSFLDFKAPTNQGWGYAVFGKVTDGMDIVDAIAKVKTQNKMGHADVPVDDVVIQTARIVK